MSIFSLTGNDRFFFLISFVPILATYVLIYNVIHIYTKNSYFAYVGLILFVFTPTTIGFSSDVYVDAFGTLLTTLLLYFYVQLTQKNDVNYFYYALLLIPLLFLAKSNSAFLAIIIYIFLIFALRARVIVIFSRILLTMSLTLPFALPFGIRFLITM